MISINQDHIADVQRHKRNIDDPATLIAGLT
jgi:hypothetical protein